MIVSVSGPPGCGKTTAIKRVMELIEIQQSAIKRGHRFGGKTGGQYIKGAIQEHTARRILDDWNVSLAEIMADTQKCMDFHDEIVNRKAEHERQFVSDDLREIWITERSPLDSFVFAMAALSGRATEPGVEEWLEQFYNRCLSLHNSYYEKSYMILGGKIAIDNDGTRPTNVFYIDMINWMMQRYITTNNNPAITVNSHVIDLSDLDQRADMIIQTLPCMKLAPAPSRNETVRQGKIQHRYIKR